jgi:hypothetical protein
MVDGWRPACGEGHQNKGKPTKESNSGKGKNISGGEKNELKPLPTASLLGRE